jgi:hypothetical protein
LISAQIDNNNNQEGVESEICFANSFQHRIHYDARSAWGHEEAPCRKKCALYPCMEGRCPLYRGQLVSNYYGIVKNVAVSIITFRLLNKRTGLIK